MKNIKTYKKLPLVANTYYEPEATKIREYTEQNTIKQNNKNFSSFLNVLAPPYILNILLVDCSECHILYFSVFFFLPEQ